MGFLVHVTINIQGWIRMGSFFFVSAPGSYETTLINHQNHYDYYTKRDA